MGYCEAEDVSVLLGLDNFSSSTRPKLTQVNTIIADITSEIDFTLQSVGITNPPTDTRILGRLSIMCKMGTASHVGFSAFGNSKSVDNSQPDKYWQSYQSMLGEITSKPELYGAVSGDSNLFVSNQVLDGTHTETEALSGRMPETYIY
jgi:hypothetical protein